MPSVPTHIIVGGTSAPLGIARRLHHTLGRKCKTESPKWRVPRIGCVSGEDAVHSHLVNLEPSVCRNTLMVWCFKDELTPDSNLRFLRSFLLAWPEVSWLLYNMDGSGIEDYRRELSNGSRRLGLERLHLCNSEQELLSACVAFARDNRRHWFDPASLRALTRHTLPRKSDTRSHGLAGERAGVSEFLVEE